MVPVRRPHVYWRWQELDDEDWEWFYVSRTWRQWIGPDLLTTQQAARAWAISPATIRQWVHRGYLAPVGTEGRSAVFAARDVYRVALATGDRNLQPGGPLRRDDDERRLNINACRGRDLQELVTAEEAAVAVGVSPATIRSWKHRGHLPPAQHRGRTPLYRLADVLTAARRKPHRPRRLYREKR